MSQRSSTTVFDLPLWQRTWWEFFGEESDLKLLTVGSGRDEIDLIAPLVCRDGVVSFLGGTDLVDYHDFICADGPGESCLDALLRNLSNSLSAHTVLLESLPEDTSTLEQFRKVAESAGWTVEVKQEDVAPRLELGDDWEEYVASLRKKDRHELRRKLRRLNAAGEVNHYELRSREDVESGMDDFFRLHRMSMPEKEEFMTAERERFFREVSARLADEDVTRLTFLELDGERLATSLSYVVDGVRYLYNSGYNPQRRDLSVGLLNHALSIKASIEQGHSVFDFMRGDEIYKYHLGGVDRNVFRLSATR